MLICGRSFTIVSGGRRAEHRLGYSPEYLLKEVAARELLHRRGRRRGPPLVGAGAGEASA
ncbi:hypothetical protein HBB16_04975 [Pseudonocardia sp. MCCB 268]|nr:hypothetical protein [Pseudonocardia cytotoxica]